MTFEFEYLSDKGEIISITTEEPNHLKDDGESFVYLNRLRVLFKFNKKTFLMVLNMFCDIRFTRHTTSSWTTEGTITQFASPFLEAATNAQLRPRIKYIWRLSDKGIELYNTLEAILLVEDNSEESVLDFIKGYITFKEES